MSTGERVRICKLLVRMETHQAYSNQIGLENASRFQGRPVTRENVVWGERMKKI